MLTLNRFDKLLSRFYCYFEHVNAGLDNNLKPKKSKKGSPRESVPHIIINNTIKWQKTKEFKRRLSKVKKVLDLSKVKVKV